MMKDADDESVSSGYDFACVFNEGKWTAAEVEYMLCLIDAFKAGYLPLKNGTTLRGFLSKRLSCKPKRISKRFEGIQYKGRLPYTKCQLTPRNLEAANECLDRLKQLEKCYLEAERSNKVPQAKKSRFACQERSVPKRMVSHAAKCGLLGSEVAASEHRKEIAKTMQQARACENSEVSHADTVVLWDRATTPIRRDPAPSAIKHSSLPLPQMLPREGLLSPRFTSRNILETLLAASAGRRDGGNNNINLAKSASPLGAMVLPRQIMSAPDLAGHNPSNLDNNALGFMMDRFAVLANSSTGGNFRGSTPSQGMLGLDVVPLSRMASGPVLRGVGLQSFFLEQFQNSSRGGDRPPIISYSILPSTTNR